MSESTTITGIAKNLLIYAVGVGFAVTGALGIAEAFDLPLPLAGVLFVAGLAVVLYVHEYLGGPL
ncbi:hypothetical protein [Natronobacterium gregoryi]|uniref:Uncharacterized protein n=2 Tax=Natronobacterium gregoryi TaxID=44930 RepID=L0AKH1_NATGS|nr:hypothetical protein [Natronobacterium gregoryi]AFZ73652.1 hypothetical protein Natgr_2487 [Natronobacterium gregoryi SP2]ELY67846.1 hypothetical protein C490_10570 [Natronobacterium gregoryi SP2]PLK19624.1 hypothetical protein CYV19_13935 [Natronobacterium gregoryi SP2]SFJ00299.1 hypothetical protein SAMN05443661_11116 [Natronobacterium gregoryi]